MDIKIVKGIGEGPTEIAAFDKAPFKAGIHDFNLIKLSSVVPKNSKINKIKKWHTRTLVQLRFMQNKEIKILGKKFIVLPGVFPPIFPDSIILAKNILKEVKKNDRVLDIGTGSGIQAIFAASKSNEIVATDISNKALKCAEFNIKKYKFQQKICLKKSNLFSKISGKFDLIIFNPPFRWFKPKNFDERSETDENYFNLQKFFRMAKKFMSKNARIIMVFSNSGDIEFFESLIVKNNFYFKIISKKKSEGWLYRVYKIIS